MIHFQFRSPAEEVTLRFGAWLGRTLAAPAWIGLRGPLGAGKTRLAQGIASGLGYRGRVRSPSYVLEHRYRGCRPILHLDLDRLDDAGADLRADWEEEDVAVVLVEWAERTTPPDDALAISLSPSGETARWIDLAWPGGHPAMRNVRLETLLPGLASRATGVPAETA